MGISFRMNALIRRRDNFISGKKQNVLEAVKIRARSAAILMDNNLIYV
jgi:hypothetical protein